MLFLLAMLTGSALAPFLQAIVTKAGDDVRAKIRNLLCRCRRRKDTERMISNPPTDVIEIGFTADGPPA